MESDEREMFSNVSITERYIEVDENVQIKVYFFRPESKKGSQTLFFIPGWTSTIYSWRYFLPKVTKIHPVIYIETREKRSSKVPNKCSYSVSKISNDIVTLVSSLVTDDESFSLIGSSLGATTILEALTNSNLSPLSISLILPNQHFDVPSYAYLLNQIPNSFFGIIKKVIKWYMLRFKISRDDTVHQISFLRSLNKVDGSKLVKSALAFKRYQMDKGAVSKITIRALIIGASKDPLHNHNDIVELSRIIPNCEFVDLESFHKSHSSIAADRILHFSKQVLSSTQ